VVTGDACQHGRKRTFDCCAARSRGTSRLWPTLSGRGDRWGFLARWAIGLVRDGRGSASARLLYRARRGWQERGRAAGGEVGGRLSIPFYLGRLPSARFCTGIPDMGRALVSSCPRPRRHPGFASRLKKARSKRKRRKLTRRGFDRQMFGRGHRGSISEPFPWTILALASASVVRQGGSIQEKGNFAFRLHRVAATPRLTSARSPPAFRKYGEGP